MHASDIDWVVNFALYFAARQGITFPGHPFVRRGGGPEDDRAAALLDGIRRRASQPLNIVVW